MKRITKNGWIGIAGSSLVFIALILVASFYDLAINKALYAPHTLFGQFFDKLGQLPSYIAVPFAGAIFFRNKFGKTSRANLAFKLLSILFIFGGWSATLDWLWSGFVAPDVSFKSVYLMFFTLITTVGTLHVASHISSVTARKLLIFAIFIVISFAISNIIVQVMKIIWNRQRFRTMVDIPKNAELLAAYGKNFEGFTAWYKPMSILNLEIRTPEYMRLHLALDSDAFKSFPSGHTVAASAAFGVILLPDIYEGLAKHRWKFTAFPALYVALVAVSRIVMGAHYLSDVVFGGFIGFGVTVLLRHIFIGIAYKKGNLLPSKNEL
ncbi:MAG: phosphatase PAP2 family protein [Christensenellaceae bacterium]|jgi:membrane-associated phospholipid phosphatase|nr:phosphatase PAP2 family protein [Christensenellaceae bacterium]